VRPQRKGGREKGKEEEKKGEEGKEGKPGKEGNRRESQDRGELLLVRTPLN